MLFSAGLLEMSHCLRKLFMYAVFNGDAGSLGDTLRAVQEMKGSFNKPLVIRGIHKY